MNEEKSMVAAVRERTVERRKELESDPNTPARFFEYMEAAEKYVSHPKAFAVSDPVTSLSILKFLGYKQEELSELFYKLVFEQSTKADYVYVDSNQFDENLDRGK